MVLLIKVVCVELIYGLMAMVCCLSITIYRLSTFNKKISLQTFSRVGTHRLQALTNLTFF